MLIPLELFDRAAMLVSGESVRTVRCRCEIGIELVVDGADGSEAVVSSGKAYLPLTSAGRVAVGDVLILGGERLRVNRVTSHAFGSVGYVEVRLLEDQLGGRRGAAGGAANG